MNIKRPNLDAVESRIKTAWLNGNDIRELVEYILFLEVQFMRHASHDDNCSQRSVLTRGPCDCGLQKTIDVLAGRKDIPKLDPKLERQIDAALAGE